jgi:serine/threonine protein kinase/Tol biopolymer transport system component
MPIAPGTRLGHYEVLSPIGQGGMGEVYRGRDTRLDRIVAIKLLPPEMAADPESRQRLHAEARAVSLLNHPNICALFDIGSNDAVDFLVMELLQGETLADRVRRGPLPFEQLIRIASEIMMALDAAHAQGVVHRDLKPSNVMLTKTGVKLLDFGIAKVRHTASGSELETRSIGGVTAEGAVIGTLQYMAPEQLEGQEIDLRVDIFSLGAVLYEMATGQKAFEGRSQASLTAAILEREPPPPSSLVATLPLPFDRLVRRCLSKDPEERWQSARDILFQLKEIANDEAVVRARATDRRTKLAWSLAVLATLSAAVLAIVIWTRPSTTTGTSGTFHISLPPGLTLPSREAGVGLALSPDGTQIAFVAVRNGRPNLWLRALNRLEARLLPGTDEARHLFWSPDGRFIGFFAAGKLQRIDVAGGPPHVICEAPVDTSPSWGPDGTILFALAPGANRPGGIYRVSAEGGPVTPVTTVDTARGESEHYWPSFLPDGEHFLYMATIADAETASRRHTIFVRSIADSAVTRVADMDSRAVYASPGYLLYAQEGALMARRFDLRTFSISGDPVRLADRLWYVKSIGTAEFSASTNGILAYHGGTTLSELVWFDRSGKQLQTLGSRAWLTDVRMSPDERTVAVAAVDPRFGSADLWMYDRESGIPTRFTFDNLASSPVWSSDGSLLFFRSIGQGPPDIYRRRSDGRGEKERLLDLPGVQLPLDVSRDGRYLIYEDANRVTGRDIWRLSLSGAAVPEPYLRTLATESDARVSPDSRWLAFVSTESENPEIYVAPIDDPGRKRRVSVAGGIGPRWRRDGRELVYLDQNTNTLMAVPLTAAEDLKAGVPRALFSPGRVFKNPSPGFIEPYYEMTSDGQSFLVNRIIEDPDLTPITVVLDWTAAVSR